MLQACAIVLPLIAMEYLLFVMKRLLNELQHLLNENEECVKPIEKDCNILELVVLCLKVIK